MVVEHVRQITTRVSLLVWRRRQPDMLHPHLLAVLLSCVIAIVQLPTPPAIAADAYANGFPAEAAFFPIGVWMQSPSRAAQYRALGINTFVGLWEGPTEQQLALLARQSMFAVTEQNDVGLNSANRGVIKAWMDIDEPDNAQPGLFGLHWTCLPAADVVRRTQEMKRRDATRPVVVNFGQGVANEFWRGRGRCNGDQDYYSRAITDADIMSFDIYPVGSTTPQVKDKLEYVAHGISNLVKRAAPGQAVWIVLETAALDPDHRPTPAQIRTETWMALIHGATGIMYFVHELKPAFREDAIFRYPEVVTGVRQTNELIRSLAPVLNSPTVSGAVTIRSQTDIATMMKVHDATTYLFTVAMQNVPSTARITFSDKRNGSAEVIGEDRSVTITQGVLEDQFDGYGVHLYRIN